MRRGMQTRRRGAGTVRNLGLGLAAACLLAACGYRPLGETGPPAGRRSVVLQAITNETLRPGIQGIVSAEVLRQLRLHGISSGAESGPPDLVLSGGITGYQNEAIAFGVQDIGRRFRVRVIMSATLARRSDGSIRLTEAIVGEAFYTAGAGAVTTQNAEDEALRRAAQDVASKLVARVLEEW